ncbi:MAG: LpqB family beta-propeller domain-containing protein [Geodermatophilaceae bacterium]
MRRRAAATLAVLAVTLSLSGCVGIPENSDPVPVAVVESDSLDDTGVQIEALAPKPGQQPDEVVRGFLAASASNVRSQPVARLYLTETAAEDWADDVGVTVIERNFSLIPSPDGTEVTLIGRITGRIDGNGVYLGAEEELRQVLRLRLVGGQWRIDNPPPGVLLRVDDFRRAYVQYNLYFLDPTGSKVVPDPRYFLSGSVARANSLVEELLDGPSPFLAGAVTTEFGPDVELRSNVQEVRDVEIDLTGLEERSPASLERLSAQLIWTLKQLSIAQLTLRSDGQLVSVPGVGGVQGADDWQSYDPDFVPADAVGHYLDQGAVWTDEGRRMPGPAGEGTYALSSAGASAEQTTLAGVRASPSGATLLLGSYGGALSPVLTGQSFSAPTWAEPTQEVWVVRDGNEVVRVPAGAPPQVVTVSDLGDRGSIRALQMSRDGTRAAVIVGAPGAADLYIARVARTGSTVQLSGFTQLATPLRDVVDVAWATATQLLLLATDPADGRNKPWLVSVDGAALTAQAQENLPEDASGIAAAPGRPALASAVGSMYRLDGTTWTTLVRGLPFFPGTAPFYPG